MNNNNTISIPRYHAEYGSKIIENYLNITPSIHSNKGDIQVDFKNHKDRYKIDITDIDELTLTQIRIFSSSSFVETSNKMQCFVANKDLKNKKIYIVDSKDNPFLQKLIIKYHTYTDNSITLVKCDGNHVEDNLFEKIKNQQEHKFYRLIKKNSSYELLQQHGLIPSATCIMCTSCDIEIPYNTLNAETADPQSILKISEKYHKDRNRISEHISLVYYCKDRTEYSELIQLHNAQNNDIPLIHYHQLKLINSYEIDDTTPLKSLCDMSYIYFFLLPPEENIISNRIIIECAIFLCEDLEQALLAVNYISENKFFIVGTYLDSIARFICSYSKYLDTTEDKLDRGIRLLEVFLDALKNNGLKRGLLSAIFGDKTLNQPEYLKATDVYSATNNSYNRIFNYVEAINQLYLFPLLEIIIKLMATLNLDQNPNSEFIQRLLPLLEKVYILPQNSVYSTQEQYNMLLNAISQAKK